MMPVSLLSLTNSAWRGTCHSQQWAAFEDQYGIYLVFEYASKVGLGSDRQTGHVGMAERQRKTLAARDSATANPGVLLTLTFTDCRVADRATCSRRWSGEVVNWTRRRRSAR